MFNFKPHTRLQLHALKSHAPSNLNRDDAGRPKEVRVGGVRRLRLSSQSLKYAMRQGEVFAAFRESAARDYGAAAMLRTRMVPKELFDALVKRAMPEDKAHQAITEFAGLMEKEKEASEAEAEATEEGETQYPKTQLLALSRREIESIAEALTHQDLSAKNWFKDAMTAWKQERKGLRSRGDLSPELQLFGRMITARDYFGNIDSPLQVAHAFTTHEAISERDYWIGADDLLNRAEGETGGGMIDVRRFGAGVFYQYACLDVALLRDNLAKSFIQLDDEQRESLLQDMVSALVWAFAVQNPTGYQNSFASHAIADTLIAEVGGAFPHSAAAAFERPVQAGREGSYLVASRKALEIWDEDRKRKYGEAVFPAMNSLGLRDDDSDMPGLIDWIGTTLAAQREVG